MEQAILDLEQQILEAIGASQEELEENLDQNLRALAVQYLAQMRSGRFRDQSGDLRRSMFARVEDNTLKLGMLFYGYFVSFGVQGNKYQGLPLTDEVASIFNKRPGNTFGTQERAGLRPRQFYPTDLAEQVDKILAEALQKVEI